MFHYKSIIALNGSLPPLPSLKQLKTDKIIAADGGAHHLIKQGYSSTYIIGDNDSYKINSKIREMRDQETTDFQKALIFAKKENLLPALVLGMNGGEIDHIYGNQQVLMRHAQEYPSFFLDTYEKESSIWYKLGVPVLGKVTFKTEPGETFSIIPSGNAIVSSTGLKWELNKALLGTDEQIAVRNKTTSSQVTIEVHEGKVLVILDQKTLEF